jgi:hypothetical protein
VIVGGRGSDRGLWKAGSHGGSRSRNPARSFSGARTLADTFDLLRQRSESIRSRLDRVDWCSISVEMESAPVGSSRNVGVVRIDDGVAGDLTGGEPRSFRVTPGAHTVVVRLRKRLWLYGSREKAVVSFPVDLKSGEKVRLVCGVRPEAQEAAVRAHRAERDLIRHFCVGGGLALAVGWAANTYIDEFIERAADRLRVPSFWIPFALWLVGSRLATAVWGVVIWWIFMGRFSVEKRRRLAVSLKAEILEPYFLKKVESLSEA